MHAIEHRKMRIKKVRDHDYIYDPNFIVSHYKDFYKQARKSAMASAQCTVHPIYSSMFSELSQYKRLEVVCHPNARLPNHLDISYPREGEERPRDTKNDSELIDGKHRALFFSAPQNNLTVRAKLDQVQETTTTQHNQVDTVCINEEERFQNKGVQTLLRESSAQTDPYTPDYFISRKCNDVPQIVLFENIDSSHEGNVLSVKRQRVRRAWLQRAFNFKVLSQLDKFEYKFREKELEKILLLEEEKLGTQIFSTVDKERLNNIWNLKSQNLQKKISQIKHNKEREIRKLDRKFNNRTGKNQRCPSTYIKKPIKLVVNLEYLPDETDFKYQVVDLNPKVKNKFGICDKFMKRRERGLATVQAELQKILQPEEETLDDTMSWDDEEEEEIVIPEVEKMDKNVATDFLMNMLEKYHYLKEKSAEEYFNIIKENVLKYVMKSLHKELDYVMEERLIKEMEEETANQEIIEQIKAKERKSKQQIEMYKEVEIITRRISSTVLNEMFEQVANNILIFERGSIQSKDSESSLEQDEVTLADLIMDMILPMVVEEIERRQKARDEEEQFESELAYGSPTHTTQKAELEYDEDIIIDNQAMCEVLEVVQKAGNDVLNEIFSAMFVKISSENFISTHSLSERSALLSKKSGESFINDIIMHELLPEVIEELSKKKNMYSDSVTTFGEFDDEFGHMLKVVGAIQTVASEILDTVIQETTQESFSDIKKAQSTTSTKMKQTFIKDIIMDTLLPDVVEDLKKKRKEQNRLIDEAEVVEVVQVIEDATSSILRTMFVQQPSQTESSIRRKESIENFVWNQVVMSLPERIRTEIDPRFYFGYGEDTTEAFVWGLVVSSLPKPIKDKLEISKDISKMTKLVGTVKKAASGIFNEIFDQVSDHVKTGKLLERERSDYSFFTNMILSELMPKAIKQANKKRCAHVMSMSDIDLPENYEVTNIVEKVASCIVEDILAFSNHPPYMKEDMTPLDLISIEDKSGEEESQHDADPENQEEFE